MREALSLWEERERRGAEILAAADTAESLLARGEGRSINQQSMRDAAGIKRRLRLSSQQHSSR